MNSPSPASSVAAKAAPALPPPRWWAYYNLEGTPPRARLVIRWRRILSVLVAVVAVGYVSLMTALWGFYVWGRKIPSVQWSDVVLARFDRMQAAIGDYFYSQAKDAWAKQDYVRAVFTGRAAVLKSPANLDARLFLASCWLNVGRSDEAVQTLRQGIPFDASDPRLQSAVLQACMQTNHYDDLVAALGTDFPAHGVNLLDSAHRAYELADVRAIFEAKSAEAAQQAANGFPGLDSDPAAAPLFAEIDWELGRHEAALARLAAALQHSPAIPAVEDSYVDIALRLGRTAEARKEAMAFLRQDPRVLMAQLRFLDVFGSRKGADEQVWTAVCIRVLAQHRNDPAALSQLGSLAASKGWTDLAYLLYQNSLHDNLSGFPFAIYYAGSLVKAGDISDADEVWHELQASNSQQTDAAGYIGAMIDWATNRESEALQIVDRLRHDAADDRHKRRLEANVFRDYGYPKLADLLAGPESQS